MQVSSNYDGISLVIPLKIQGVPAHATIDTAAQVSIISEGLAKRIKPPLISIEKVLLRGAQKSSNMVANRVPNIPLEIGGSKYSWDILIAPISDEFILGLDFLKANNAKIDLKGDVVTINGNRIYADMRKNQHKLYSTQRVELGRKVVVPPNSVVAAEVKFTHNTDKLYMIHAPEHDHKRLSIPYSLVSVKSNTNPVQATRTGLFLTVRNDSDRYIHVKRGHVIGRAEEVDENIPVSDH